MKKILSRSLLAALAAAGFAHAAEVATTPVGYVTTSLQPGFNLLGITLHKPVVVQGNFDSVSGNQLTDVNINPTVLPAGKTFILEITSGLAEGFVQEFVSISNDTLVLPAAIPNLAVNDGYTIRVAPTLEEIFGTTLQTRAVSAGSDIVWLANGPGVFEKYYLNTPFFGSPVWKRINSDGTETNAPNTPVVYLDGIFVEVKTTGKNLIVSGELRAKTTSIALGTGFNAIGTVFPVGSTLSSSGLAATLQTRAVAAGSDIVWVAAGVGVFDKYYYNTPFFGAPTWKRINPDSTEVNINGSAVNLSSGMFIERKGGAASMKLVGPAYGL